MINTDAVSVAGRAAGPTLLLIHGSTVTRAMWEPQTAALADEFRVITFDLPGHGANAALPFTMDRAAAYVDAALTLYGHSPAIVVGISLGGFVALAHAARYQRGVAGLVLAGATTDFTGPLGAYLRVVGWLLRRVVSEEAQRTRLARSIRQKYPPAIADHLIRAGLYPRAAGHAFAELAGFDALGALELIDRPILFLNGADDAPSLGGEAAFLARARRGSRHRIAGAGHLCSLEQPEQFTDAVRRFARAVHARCAPVLGRPSAVRTAL